MSITIMCFKEPTEFSKAGDALLWYVSLAAYKSSQYSMWLGTAVAAAPAVLGRAELRLAEKTP